MDDTDVEEHEGHQQGSQEGKHEDLHGDVALVALHLHVLVLTLEGLAGEASGVLDDTPRLDDADDTAHRDTTDTDVAGTTSKDLVRCHLGVLGIHTQQGYDYPPDEGTTGKDDKRVGQADDVAQTQHSGTGVDLEDHLHVVGEVFHGGDGLGREHLFPPTEGREQEVIQTTHQTGDEQRTGLVATLLATDEHLGRRGSLGERELAVHVAHKVLAEGDKEKDA